MSDAKLARCGARVVLVSLDRPTALEVVGLLGRLVYDVADHASVESALEDLGRRHVDAIAVDLLRAHGEGAALVRAAVELHPYVAVVACGAASHGEILEVLGAGARDATTGSPEAGDLARRVESELHGARLRRFEDVHRAAWRLLRCATWDECAAVTVEEAERVLAPCSAWLEPASGGAVGARADGAWAMPVCEDPEVALVVRWAPRADAAFLQTMAAAFLEDVRVAFESAALRTRLEEQIEELERERAERSQLETALVRAEKVAAVGMIAAGIAHEVNNPLALVLTNLEVLAERVTAPKEVASMISESLDGARRVRDVVRQLASFSPRATDPTAAAVFDLRQTIEAVGRLTLPTVRLRGALSLELANEPLPVRGSPGQLAQALSNVVANAAQALGDAGRGHVEVRARVEGGRVVVEIEDDGAGIPADAIDRVFDPFFTTRAQGGGTGLGLPITAEIVHAHGGMIDIASEVGVGTTVRIVLPLARTASGSLATPRAERGPRPRVRVLLVDDEAALLRALARALAVEMDVTTATAARALELLRDGSRSFDLVVSDFLMPDLGGDQLYEIVLRERPDLAPRFVVASGAHHDDRLQEFLAKTGVRAIAKPFGAAELREAHAALGGDRR